MLLIHWPWWILVLFICTAGVILIPTFILWKSDQMAGKNMVLVIIVMTIITALYGFFGLLAVMAVMAARESRVSP